MADGNALLQEIANKWAAGAASVAAPSSDLLVVDASGHTAVSVAEWLVGSRDFHLASMTVREEGELWHVHYLFYCHERGNPWVEVRVRTPLDDSEIPSLSTSVHAADWLEREAEDHFGVRFGGHPRLGDFVLHDEDWQEAVAPMRKRFDARKRDLPRRPHQDWRPRRILEAPGAFSMTVGPIHGGIAEPVHYLIESVGEDMVRVYPRLFYKYRAIEKLAEGRDIEYGLQLAGRFDALRAFAHSLGYCRAIERLQGIEAPARAEGLRVVLAELERLRSHTATIRGICGSTGLAVAESHAAIIEEKLLRICGIFGGHRYLFGLNAIGGLSTDVSDDACRVLVGELSEVKGLLEQLRGRLVSSSSFLDRLEEVGVVEAAIALEHGLVGPVARASGLPCDMRSVMPYSGYERCEFQAASEVEGDGYARLRVYFFEALQSIEIIGSVCTGLETGPVRASEGRTAGSLRGTRGASFGWVEAPAGAALHSVWLDGEGRIERYRIAPPSFFNWHGLHAATEGFAFQDFPIILATFGLSVAENDR